LNVENNIINTTQHYQCRKQHTRMSKNNIRIYRINKNKGSTNTFTQLPNTVVDDLRLSNGAFRILVQVLRQIDFYKFHIKHYSSKMGCSRNTMRQYLDELIHFGYCRQESITKSNVQYYWYESPELNPAYQSDGKEYRSKSKLERNLGGSTQGDSHCESGDYKLISISDAVLIEEFNSNENKLITDGPETDHPMSKNWSETDQRSSTNNTKLNTTTILNNNTQNISEEEVQNFDEGNNQHEEVVADANTKYDNEKREVDDLWELNSIAYLAGEKDRRRRAEEESRLSAEMYFESQGEEHFVKENIAPASGTDSIPSAMPTKVKEKIISTSHLILTDNKNFIGRLVRVFDERTSPSSISQRAKFCYYDNSGEVFLMAYNEKVHLLKEIKPGDIFQVEYTTGDHVLFLFDLFLLDDELKYINKKPAAKSRSLTVKSKNPYNDMMR
jgi:hypothetical protein